MKKLNEFNYRYGKTIFNSNILVPNNYIFENHIDSFLKIKKETDKKISHYICDKNFSKASHRFIPGKEYIVEVVPIIQYISHCEEVLSDLIDSDVFLVGAQGLVLFKEQFPDCLPFKDHLFSFDKKESLFKNEFEYQVPYMYDFTGGCEFSTINFWSSLSSDGNYLLCFYEK